MHSIKYILWPLVGWLLMQQSQAQVTASESQKAAKVIGQWLSKNTGHYDYQSATTVNPKRAGNKFFGIPDMQTASDYGISYMQAPRTNEVTNALGSIGANTSSMASSLRLARLHLNLGFANKHDFNFSYLFPFEEPIRGWGVGYKKIISQWRYLYLSYRFGYARSESENYFSASSYVNDLSASVYLRLIDIYIGMRHWAGKVRFYSAIPQLELQPIEYFSTASEIEPYAGIIAATTTNTRWMIEMSSLSDSYTISTKFSFHFDSLFPTFNNWFRDPRYIKQ